MSSFFIELWESIFVPGPTPVLLRAANISFAALQITLFALLVATYSIHFVFLSVISAGLWWSINWFAAELAAAKARGDIPSGNEGDQAAAASSAVGAHEQKRADHSAPLKAVEDGSDDTEVEGKTKKRAKKAKKASKGGAGVAVPSKDIEVVEKKGELKHRGVSTLDSSGFISQSSVSTEDEWEKVSENENDKAK